jgi:hypothetical protein
LLSATLLTPALAQAQEADGTLAPWYERVHLSGDFRSRYEGFYQDQAETRHRGRLRLRLRIDAAINDDLSFQARIATGDMGTPVSTNQTFTGFFAPKPLNLDRAFIAYNPQVAEALTLGLGKFGLPQLRTQMVFDDDINVEGVWQRVSWSPTAGVSINLTALETAVNEASRSSDAFMLGGAAGVTVDVGAHTLELSLANYHWSNADQIALAQAAGPLKAILTNVVTRDEANNIVGFASEFNVIDFIAEATIDTGHEGYPLRLLVDIARNTQAENDRDSGFWLEAAYGDPSNPGTWGTSYTYGWLEQDVTPSAFMFSDIPGTNLRLHMVETSYVPLPGLSLDVTLHLTRRLVPVAGSTLSPWLSRLHTAAVISF